MKMPDRNTWMRLHISIRILILFGPIVAVFGAWFIYLHHYEIQWRTLASDLAPQIDKAHRLAVFHEADVPSPLFRPYIIIYDSDSGPNQLPGKIINAQDTTTPPPLESVRTLILVRVQLLDSANYQVTRKAIPFGKEARLDDRTYFRRRYRLSAIDLTNSKLGASIILDDGDFGYLSPGHTISEGEMIKWADSVTSDDISRLQPAK